MLTNCTTTESSLKYVKNIEIEFSIKQIRWPQRLHGCDSLVTQECLAGSATALLRNSSLEVLLWPEVWWVAYLYHNCPPCAMVPPSELGASDEFSCWATSVISASGLLPVTHSPEPPRPNYSKHIFEGKAQISALLKSEPGHFPSLSSHNFLLLFPPVL